MFRCGRLYSGQKKTRGYGTAGNITFRKRIDKQKYLFYVNAARQAMFFFGAKMRFVLAYVCSGMIIAAGDNSIVVVKKLKRKLGC
jgi:hypothetical protein